VSRGCVAVLPRGRASSKPSDTARTRSSDGKPTSAARGSPSSPSRPAEALRKADVANRLNAQVLDALARVLQLDEVERRYLHGLAGAGPAQRRRDRARRAPERVPPRLHQLLAALGVPAFVEGRAFDVLAANPLATALSPRLRPGQNRLRSLLLDPEERAFHQDWEASTAGFVAAFRESIAQDADDPRVVEIVGELALTSGRFRELWARHDVRRLEGGTARVNHPVLGPLSLHRDKLPVDEVILVLYYADAGSDSAEKLAMLASLVEPDPARR